MSGKVNKEVIAVRAAASNRKYYRIYTEKEPQGSFSVCVDGIKQG